MAKRNANGRYECYVCGRELEDEEVEWGRPYGSTTLEPCHRDDCLRFGVGYPPKRHGRKKRGRRETF